MTPPELPDFFAELFADFACGLAVFFFLGSTAFPVAGFAFSFSVGLAVCAGLSVFSAGLAAALAAGRAAGFAFGAGFVAFAAVGFTGVPDGFAALVELDVFVAATPVGFGADFASGLAEGVKGAVRATGCLTAAGRGAGFVVVDVLAAGVLVGAGFEAGAGVGRDVLDAGRGVGFTGCDGVAERAAGFAAGFDCVAVDFVDEPVFLFVLLSAINSPRKFDDRICIR